MIPCLSQGSFCTAEHCFKSFKATMCFICFFKDFFFLTGKEKNGKIPFQMCTHAKSREFVRIVERNDTANGSYKSGKNSFGEMKPRSKPRHSIIVS